MNIEDIKNNKLWFFVVGGVIFVIAFYFSIVIPFRSRNIEKMKVLKNVLSQLERYKTRGINIHNEKWIKEEKSKLEAISSAQTEYKLFYKKRTDHLEKIFDTVYGEEIKDEALWENRYIQEVNVLLGKIKKRHISLSENALPFKRWKLEIPTWEEIDQEQKRFWVTEELINILLKEELHAGSLDSINFEKEEVSTSSHPESYDVIPFTLKASMDVESLLFLINNILKSKICFEIKTISISGELYRLQPQERTEKRYKLDRSGQKKETQSSSTVDVVVKADVLDFKI
ncbi:MAG: hypothetical protein GY777_14955 [Candidatus Brocadiaceae bacterium]|nr:hypothetical protein [Candidatus Brocadiaceae bacterium]